jgi:hypothetical protein
VQVRIAREKRELFENTIAGGLRQKRRGQKQPRLPVQIPYDHSAENDVPLTSSHSDELLHQHPFFGHAFVLLRQ